MKNFLLIFLLFPLCSFKNTAVNNADAIIGKWMSEENNLEVEVFKSGNEYKAKVIWFDDTDDKTRPMAERYDLKNPDKALRSRKIIGLEVMYGLTYNEDDDEWQDGHIYDSSTGKEWNAKMWLTKQGVLKVRGYWHISLLGQTMLFKKV
jgi:uncharacterized protein (DUF2147 family)